MANDPNWRPGTGDKIERLYAWVVEEPDGGEGLCSAQFGPLHMPLIGADRERIESFRKVAEHVATTTGNPVRLVAFESRRNIQLLQRREPDRGRN